MSTEPPRGSAFRPPSLVLQFVLLAAALSAPMLFWRTWCTPSTGVAGGGTTGGSGGAFGSGPGRPEKPEGFEAVFRSHFLSRRRLRSGAEGLASFFAEIHALKKKDPYLYRKAFYSFTEQPWSPPEGGALLAGLLSMLASSTDPEDLSILSNLIFGHTLARRDPADSYSLEEVGLVSGTLREEAARVQNWSSLRGKLLRNCACNFARAYGSSPGVAELIREIARQEAFLGTLREDPEGFTEFCLSPCERDFQGFQEAYLWVLSQAGDDASLLSELADSGWDRFRGSGPILGRLRNFSSTGELSAPSITEDPKAAAEASSASFDFELLARRALGPGLKFESRVRFLTALVLFDAGRAKAVLSEALRSREPASTRLAALKALLLTVGLETLGDEGGFDAAVDLVSRAVSEGQIVENKEHSPLLSQPRQPGFFRISVQSESSRLFFMAVAGDLRAAAGGDGGKLKKLAELEKLIEGTY